MQLSEEEQGMIDRFAEHAATKGVSNEFLVQLIKLSGGFLNLQTIPDYAKNNKLSYNGVKNNRQIVNLFNVKFVIDND